MSNNINDGYRLAHTMIRVKDLENSFNFYCKTLGMKVLRKTDYPEGKFTNAFIGYGLENESPCLELTYNWEQKEDFEKLDIPHAIRFKTPKKGETIIDDKIQGEVKFKNKEIEDFVLLRSDGTPTYMLSVVVDDYDMNITDIIRGDDHLINSVKQKLIFEALNWPVPTFSHLPLIHGDDGTKLSKRLTRCIYIRRKIYR